MMRLVSRTPLLIGRILLYSLSYFFISFDAQAQNSTMRVCASCHAQIVKRFAGSAMANSSGRIENSRHFEDFSNASFRDSASGMDFQMQHQNSEYLLSFNRADSEIRGQRQLKWFIGSGRVGRSYLTSIDGFLYQSPVSYYSAAKQWGASPGFQQRATIDFTRAIEPSCLRCHASQLQPIAGTQNRYAEQPFLSNGITCARCHGPGESHVAQMRKAARGTKNFAIVNPRKLPLNQRDSICAQCHLTGAARVQRANMKTEDYQPGRLLSDFISVFVWSNAAESGVTVTSHFEKLAQSSCKKNSGDRMWCATCHDPHGEPEANARVAFYKEKCLSCHQTGSCKESSAARTAALDDCISCHMPKSSTSNSEHMVYTDHSIPRRTGAANKTNLEPRLVPFWQTGSNSRDLALGYAVVAMTEPSVRRTAFDLLNKAVAENPGDIPLAAQLAQFYDRMNKPAEATGLYDRVLVNDPNHISALINQGTLLAQNGRLPEAIRFWERALRINPAQTGVRLNLAVAQFRNGNKNAALDSVQTALKYDPDNANAQRVLSEMQRQSL